MSYGQIYQHDFGTTSISSHPYTVTPTVFDANLSNSSWTNSNSAWTSFTGSSGQAISLSNSGGTPTITLTFDVASGFELDVTSFSFWRRRSSTGAQNWDMTINGISVGSGTVPTSGSDIGTTTVSNAVSNQTGTITVVISLSGASGSGTFRLDDFTLNGTVSAICTDTMDFINVQFPTTSQTITVGDNFTVFAQGYEPGVTEAAGQGAGVEAWIGYNTTNNDPSTSPGWTGFPPLLTCKREITMNLVQKLAPHFQQELITMRVVFDSMVVVLPMAA
jgi:hypothetical protein